MHIRAALRSPFFLPLLIVAGLALPGCADEDARACAVQDDCFVGEACVDGLCVEGGDTSNDDEDDGKREDTSTTPGEDVDSPDADSEDSEDADAQTDAGESCLVDRFEATCEPDEFEPNEQWASVSSLVPGDSWCDADDESAAPKTFSARLCGQDTDIHEFMVLRQSSNQCLGGGNTKITVTIDLADVPCDRELFRIYPFWNSGQDACESDDRIRCTWSNNDRRFEIVWAFDENSYQTIDFAVESTHPDLMLDYDFSVKVDTW